jgi:hypothetical protein
MLGPSPNLGKYLGQWPEEKLYLDHYAKILDEEYKYLTAGFSIDLLPTHCSGDCWCEVQHGPVSDAGHTPRFPPCAREELKHSKPFSLINIEHVSRIFNDHPELMVSEPRRYMNCFISSVARLWRWFTSGTGM